MKTGAFFYLLLVLLSSCTEYRSAAYREIYAHLNPKELQTQSPGSSQMEESDYFVILFVNARHLDYSANRAFLDSVAKTGDIGHAWIYLQGIIDHKAVSLTGGHSGELGIVQARYFDGIMNYYDFGRANITEKCQIPSRYEPNPVKYLWEVQHDGYFQYGSGGHKPTFWIKLNLTEEQFLKICRFIANYSYSEYSITGNQCSSFVAKIAALAGVHLECELTMEIQPGIEYNGCCIRLWTDPVYSRLTVSTPDVLERSMMQWQRSRKL